MKKLFLATLATFAFALITNADSGGVAILDIDEVARQLGVEEKVRVDLLTMQNTLNGELQKTQSNLQNQMAGVEQAAGQNPTEEQRRQILATNQQLNSEFNRLKTQAQQTLANERVRLINEFRIKLEPIALDAARAKNLHVVMMKVTPPVFAYDPSVDITADTAKLAMEAGMKVVAPAAPAAVPAATPAGDSKGKGKGKE
ncbi:OmpH family outer membrane protein [Verrucomicrobiales bacterium]|mgnify:CR=1 FL=1|nr:OmpH family outer membrane protein [Verrucomicrobiales bacterium]